MYFGETSGELHAYLCVSSSKPLGKMPPDFIESSFEELPRSNRHCASLFPDFLWEEVVMSGCGLE